MRDSDLICVGLNHAQTPVELREKIAFSKDQLEPALKQAILEEHIQEAAILSTCNRVEIYAQGHREQAGFALNSFLHHYHRLPENLLTPHLYHLQGQQAFRQLLRVTSSLDSLVLGEPQILGQVKSAYSQARQSGAIGPHLTRVFSQAFLTAKRVRTKTELGKNAVTIAYAAVQLAEKVFGDLAGLRCVLLGSGKMGSLALAHLKQKEAQVEVASRITHLPSLLKKADLLLTSTSADYFLIDLEKLKKIMRDRRYRPLFLIDISVPRNINPNVSGLDNVYLYNMDDLSQVVASNLEARQLKAGLAEQILAEEIEAYENQLRERQLAPIISELQSQIVLLTQQELDKLEPSRTESFEKAMRLLGAKIFHQSILALKEAQKIS